jgi:hypothetical protein
MKRTSPTGKSARGRPVTATLSFALSVFFGTVQGMKPRNLPVLLVASLSWLVGAFSSIQARNLVEAGAGTTWKYLEEETAPEGWTKAGFDDAKWKSGPAPLGYGETRLGTKLTAPDGKNARPITAWFRHEFEAPELKAGEGVVISVCLDDGAVVYLNGTELRRVNLPKGAIDAKTPAARELSDRNEGFYLRVRVPEGVLLPKKKNVLAVEVHQAKATSDDLFFDLGVKTLPIDGGVKVTTEAKEVVNAFNQQHFIGPDVKIPDGYLDGGRRMVIDDEGVPSSGREILVVNRTRDAQLTADLAYARSPELQKLPPIERVQRLVERIDRTMTPQGGERWVGMTTEMLADEFTNKPVLIGDWVEQCQAGVCRHRALLFKILGDEAGLKTALVRGNYSRSGERTGGHAWNEVTLEDGRRVLVDVMHHGAKPKFPEITAPEVTKHYLKVNDTPWYREPDKRP